ncbi:hypothetical protein HAX54_050247 [Datura stramonium]|uniref:Anaphase-promoting complex subunit 11 n=1 Tax=Datura stramonium TaxID=4076 RepID=A0ABS8WNH2_DATST|nr:hypothetical protein [Datura stramonium]
MAELKISIMHTLRQGNNCADHLAKMGRMQQEDLGLTLGGGNKHNVVKTSIQFDSSSNHKVGANSKRASAALELPGGEADLIRYRALLITEKKGRKLESCKHIFHENCLEKWLMQKDVKATCPLCRSVITSEEIKEEYRKLEDDGKRDHSYEKELALLFYPY